MCASMKGGHFFSSEKSDWKKKRKGILLQHKLKIKRRLQLRKISICASEVPGARSQGKRRQLKWTQKCKKQTQIILIFFFIYYENNLDYIVPIDKKMSETFVLQNLPFRLEE